MNKKQNKVDAIKGNRAKYVLSEESNFLMKEDYKTLRTNVTFAFPDQDTVCLGITSAGRGDGKSTTAINLAIALGQLEKKVLLVDADLRLPTVAEKLGIQNQTKGLSDFLMGQCKLSEVTFFDRKHGIYIISAGTIPADPTRLLGSENMKRFIETARQPFDYIIFDCPPVNMVVDACVLAPMIDGYLLVVGHNQNEYKQVDALLEQMNRASANIIGFVYTGADLEGQKKYKKNGEYYY